MRTTTYDPAVLADLLASVTDDPDDIDVEIVRASHTEWIVRVETHRLPGGATYNTNTRILRAYFPKEGPR